LSKVEALFTKNGEGGEGGLSRRKKMVFNHKKVKEE